MMPCKGHRRNSLGNPHRLERQAACRMRAGVPWKFDGGTESLGAAAPVVVRVSSQQAAAFCIDADGPDAGRRGRSSPRPYPILPALAIGAAGPAGAGTPLAPAIDS